MNELSILIVDGSAVTRKIVATGLQSAGLYITTIREAASGTEALQIAKQDQIDLILSEMTLPDMEGPLLLRSLQKLPPQIPVVMLTRDSSLASVQQAILAGAQGYILMPFIPERLKSYILRLPQRSYSTSLPSMLPEVTEIEHLLRTGINQGLFELHYQPLYSPAGKVCRLEALIRLRHPTLGLLPPSSFISIAESSGLIVSIGLWVIRETCRQTVEWQQQGIDVVPVSVNVSALQFSTGDLTETVRRVLKETGMSPHLLELELTESLLMEDMERSVRELKLLSQLGISIAMDDFGIGYSSLSCLHALPIHTLKIDRSFVQKIGQLGDAKPIQPILKTIIELGRSLELTIVAEGIETPQQRAELTRLGCDLLQGFLMSAPITAPEIVTLLQNS